MLVPIVACHSQLGWMLLQKQAMAHKGVSVCYSVSYAVVAHHPLGTTRLDITAAEASLSLERHQRLL